MVYDKAIADYNEAIRLDPKYALAYNGLAWLAATCPDAKYRDGKKAVQSAVTACKLTEWKEAYSWHLARQRPSRRLRCGGQVADQGQRQYSDDEDKNAGVTRLQLFRRETLSRALASLSSARGDPRAHLER